MLTRRRLLQLGVVSTLALAAGGGLAWVKAGYHLLPGEVPIALSVKEFVVVRAIVEAMFPAADGLPSGVELGIAQRCDGEIWAAADELQSDLRAAIELLEHAPPLFGYPHRLTALAPEARVACLHAMERSQITVLVQAITGLKMMTHLFYYVNDATWGPIGFDGPWVKTPIPPASSVAYEALVAARRGA